MSFELIIEKVTFISVAWTYIETGDKKIRWQGCPDGGCNYELAIQLMITMVGKQIYNNLAEIVTPYLKQLWTLFRQVTIIYNILYKFFCN